MGDILCILWQGLKEQPQMQTQDFEGMRWEALKIVL